ncbi:MAG: hypothetical protein Q9217_000371 [Psora testacea]
MATAVVKFKRCKPFFNTIIDVTVGINKDDYGIHQGLLCHASGFFKAALTGKFHEAQSGLNDPTQPPE